MMQAPFLGFGGGKASLDVSKLFATSLYTGTGAAQTISNGIDLAGKGGLVWFKNRTSALDHYLLDTARGVGAVLMTDWTGAESPVATTLTAFNSNGFSVGTAAQVNASGGAIASWSFAQDPRFFQIRTYTGNATAGRVIPHGLDPSVSVGMVIIKRRDTVGSWYVWHRGLTTGNFILLDTTAAQTSANAALIFGNGSSYVAPTASGVTVGSNAGVNASGGTYDMLALAHDTASDGVVQCGSFTADANSNATVTLGWRPQYVLVKCSNNAQDWIIYDTSRGWGAGADAVLAANTTAAESAIDRGEPSASGFTWIAPPGWTLSYLAIRAPGG